MGLEELEEKKYQEIVAQREGKSGEDRAETPKAEEESAPQNAPAEQEKAESDGAKEEAPKAETKESEQKDGGLERQKSEAERSRHAMARMRKQFASERAELERRISELESQLNPKKPKTREDFKSDDEWRGHLEQVLEDRIAERVAKRIAETQSRERDAAQTANSLQNSVIDFLGKEDGNKVWRELTTEGQEAYEIVNDPRADDMVNTICESPMKGELLGAIVYSPNVFRNILELPKSRQPFEIYRIEEQIRRNKAEIARRKSEATKRAESLPTPGSFGNNAKGKTDIGSLSTRQRVERYKKELLQDQSY